MKNEETAATIMALPGNGIFCVQGEDITETLQSIVREWQQQNAMLEAAKVIGFGKSSNVELGLNGWTYAVGGKVTGYFNSALEARAALKEQNDAG